MTEVSETGLDEALRIFADFPRGMQQQAIVSAANRAVMTARNIAWQETSKVYTVKRADFARYTKLTTHRLMSESIGFGLRAAANLVPLERYKYSGGRKGRKLSVEVIRGYETEMKDMFVANLGRGHGNAILERTTPKRESSETKFSASGAHMLDNPVVADSIGKSAAETFEKRLEHEIDRILRGYGA